MNAILSTINQYIGFIYAIIGTITITLLVIFLVRLSGLLKTLNSSTAAIHHIQNQIQNAQQSVIDTQSNIQKEKLKIQKLRSNFRTVGLVGGTLVSFKSKKR
ncbi:MAG: hypothetical protein ACK5LZ_04040 [Anaerorhabdus sp.]